MNETLVYMIIGFGTPLTILVGMGLYSWRVSKSIESNLRKLGFRAK